MAVRRFKVSSAVSGESDFFAEVALPFEEIVGELDRSQLAIRQMLNWRIEDRNIIFSPKPEAFGIVKVGDTMIEIYPKFATDPTRINHSFLTNLFQLSTKVFVGKPLSEQTLEGDVGLFDFYFYVILNDLKTFLRRYNRVILKTEEEEVIGVRGRLKPLETIRRSRGLLHKNVCEVLTVEPRAEFLGLIKGFAMLLGEFATNPSVKQRAQEVVSHLRELTPLPFNGSHIRQLKSMTRTLVSEHRAARPIIHTMLGIFDLMDAGIGDISHSCFSFNMNHHFEILATKILEKYASHNGKSVLSGNTTSLDLLSNRVSGLTILNNDDEECFEASAIKIKPDCYILGAKDEVEWVLDAKYKVLDYNSTSKTLKGVQSRDVQQLLSYWIHFFDETRRRPYLSLVYPEVEKSSGKGCLRVVGKIKLNDPTVQQDHIQLSICMLDIQKALEDVLKDDSEANLAKQVEKIAS